MSNDAKALMNYIKTLLKDGDAPAQLPAAFAGDDDFREIDETLREIRAVAVGLRVGDLSRDIAGDGVILESFKLFQNDFRDFIAHATAVGNLNFSQSAAVALDHADVFDNLTRQLATALKKMKETYETLDMIFENIPDATAITRMDDWTIMAVNQAFLDITDYTRQEVVNQKLKKFNLGISDAEFAQLYQEFVSAVNYKNLETTYRNRQNQEFIWNISLKVVIIRGIKCMLTVIRDVTELKTLEKKIIASEARHRLLTDNANDIISTVDLAGHFTYVSPAVERITGYTVDEVMNHYREIHYFTPETLKVMRKIMEIVSQVVVTGEPLQPIRFEQLQYCKDGRAIWTDTILTGIYDENGQLRELLGVTRDITDRVKLRDEIQKLSETDKLTQLYNRVRLDRALDAAFCQAMKTGVAFSLIMLDVDFFKRVNDHFGHQAGDAMLVELAQIFRDSIRARDIVGRWGGEEFLFILPETDGSGAMVVAEKIRNAVDERRFARPDRITVSLGVSTYRGDAAVDIIVSRADEALYEAKRKGRNRVQLR